MSAQFRLLRTHVGRRADHLVVASEQGFFGEPLGNGFGYTKINHFGHRLPIQHCDHDVGWLEIAVDDAFLVRVLDGVADLDEQFEPAAGV